MGILDGLRKQKGPGEPPISIAFKVTQYDGDAVVGERIDTGEQVTIRLREDKEAAGRAKPRPGVADFANPRAKVATAVGGILRADQCYAVKGKTGEFTAFWLKSQSHEPGEATVKVALARVRRQLPDEATGRKARVGVDLLKRDPNDPTKVEAKVVNSVDALADAAISALTANGRYPDNAAVAVRLAAPGEDGYGRMIFLGKQLDGQNWVHDSPQVSVAKFLDGESPDGRTVRENLQDVLQQGATIEVIPALHVPAVGDTLAYYTANADRLDKADAGWRIKKDGRVRGTGFSDTIVSMRLSDDKTFLYLTDAQRVSARSPLYDLATVPTANVPAVAAEPATPDEPADDEIALPPEPSTQDFESGGPSPS